MREEMALAPIEFFRIPPEDETEEQRLDFKKKEKDRVSEALKKAKKKPKTDEEDAQDMAALVQKITDHMTQKLLGQMDAA